MNKYKTMHRAAGILCIAVFVSGCASSGERPDGELQTAESAIQQAVSSDARDFEPVLLNQAQNKIADAEKLIETEEYYEAGRLLEQASVDAQLAAARSNTAKAKQAVEEINGNIDALRQRIEKSQ
jgi:PBP1b-binding outer membrane lipoprotein LpoB